jgi:hypothetical protein
LPAPIAEAEQVAGESYRVFYDNIQKLWRDFNTVVLAFPLEHETYHQAGASFSGTVSSVRDEWYAMLGEFEGRTPAPTPISSRPPLTRRLNDRACKSLRSGEAGYRTGAGRPPFQSRRWRVCWAAAARKRFGDGAIPSGVW